MRLEISRKTHLALEAMWVLMDTEGRMQGAPLAAKIGTSASFLAQVMKPLVQRNWIESTTGPSGGYSLGVDPESISVLDLIETIEGPTDVGCVLRGGECSTIDACAIHEAWTQARAVLQEALSRRPITSIPRQGVFT